MTKPRNRRRKLFTEKDEVMNMLRGHIYRGGVIARNTMSLGREIFNIHELPQLFRMATIYNYNGGQEIIGGRIKYYTGLSPSNGLSPIDLEREIVWCSLILEKWSNMISQFREYASKIPQCLWADSHEAGEHFFNKIEKEVGLSIWFIEAKIAFLQLHGGIEKQKEFVSIIKGKAPTRFAPFAAYYISQRNEEKTTLTRFSINLKKRLNGWSFSQSVSDYTLYILTGEMPDNGMRISGLLQAAASSSTIDLYEAFILTAHHILTHNHSEERIYRIVAQSLERLKNIQDHRLNKLRLISCYKKESTDDLRSLNFTPQDLLLRGKYSDALNEASRTIEDAPNDLQSLIAEGLCKGYQSEYTTSRENLLGQIIGDVANITSGNSEYLKSLQTLAKFALNFRWCADTYFLHQILLPELEKDPSKWAEGRKLLLLTEGGLNPMEAVAYPKQIQHSYLTSCKERYGKRTTICYERILCNIENDSLATSEIVDGISQEFRSIASLNLYISAGKTTEAILIAKNLLQSPTIAMRKTALLYLIYCQLDNGLLGDVIETIVSSYISDPNIMPVLPFYRAFNGRKYREYRNYRERMSTSIALHLYLETVEDEDQRLNLRSALDDFLRLNMVNKPSDLFQFSDKFDQPQLIYFLDKICIPLNMDVCIAFSSSRSLLEERLKIFYGLIEIDSKRKKYYQDEIIATTTQLKIQDGLRLIDQSRIHVDLDGLTRWAHRELYESFDRYLTLVSDNSEPEDIDFDKAVQQSLALRNPMPAEYYEVPQGESDNLLIEMIDALRHEFLNNPMYGLDSYLSARIRHGTLQGLIRGPVEFRGLIFINQSQILSNKWLKKYSSLEIDESQRLQEAFVDFSEKYDKIIDLIIRKLLQIKSNNHPEGVFDIELSGISVRMVRSVINESPSFDNFIQASFGVFQAMYLSGCLDAIRNIFEHTIKIEFANIFRELLASITNILRNVPHTDISSAIIEAQTESQKVIDQVKEWFRIQPVEELGARFSIEEIIDVAVDVCNQTHKGHPFKLNREFEVSSLFGPDVLTEVVDILYIIFDNIHKHSGIASPTADICIKNIGDTIYIKVDNEVDVAVINEDYYTKINNIRALLSADYHSHVKKEGGSGLIKIMKTISRHRTFSLDFDCLNNKFQVIVEMSLIYEKLMNP